MILQKILFPMLVGVLLLGCECNKKSSGNVPKVTPTPVQAPAQEEKVYHRYYLGNMGTVECASYDFRNCGMELSDCIPMESYQGIEYQCLQNVTRLD